MGITAVGESTKSGTGKLVGCLSDGDLRRILQQGQADMKRAVSHVMSHTPLTIADDHLASEAVRMMEEKKVTVLFVVNAADDLVGMVHMHDLLQAGIA